MVFWNLRFPICRMPIQFVFWGSQSHVFSCKYSKRAEIFYCHLYDDIMNYHDYSCNDLSVSVLLPLKYFNQQIKLFCIITVVLTRFCTMLYHDQRSVIYDKRHIICHISSGLYFPFTGKAGHVYEKMLQNGFSLAIESL